MSPFIDQPANLLAFGADLRLRDGQLKVMPDWGRRLGLARAKYYVLIGEWARPQVASLFASPEPRVCAT